MYINQIKGEVQQHDQLQEQSNEASEIQDITGTSTD